MDKLLFFSPQYRAVQCAGRRREIEEIFPVDFVHFLSGLRAGTWWRVVRPPHLVSTICVEGVTHTQLSMVKWGNSVNC